MDSSSSTSFIPKRNVAHQPRRPVGKRIYLFSYVAYTFFFGTLLGVVGIFFLNQQADKKLNETIALVSVAQADFDREQIKEITDIDARIRLAKQVLDAHVTLRSVFAGLESSVVESVQFASFGYTYNDGEPVKIKLEASAPDFDTILFQREMLAGSLLFSDAEFSEIMYGTAANESEDIEEISSEVRFVIEASIPVADLAYQPLNAERAAPVIETEVFDEINVEGAEEINEAAAAEIRADISNQENL